MRDSIKSTTLDEDIKGNIDKLERSNRSLTKSVFKELPAAILSKRKEIKGLPDEDFLEIIRSLSDKDFLEIIRSLPNKGFLEIIHSLPDKGLLEIMRSFPDKGYLEIIRWLPDKALLEMIRSLPDKGLLEIIRSLPDKGFLEITCSIPDKGLLEIIRSSPDKGLLEIIRSLPDKGFLEITRSIPDKGLLEIIRSSPDKGFLEIICKSVELHDTIKLLNNSDTLKSMSALTSYQQSNMNSARQTNITICSVISLGVQPVGTTTFSRYGQIGIGYNNSTFIWYQIVTVMYSLALCLESASDKLGSEGRKCYRVTTKSGATMYFVIGRTKLFSSEVFDEALVISVMINEQNGSNVDNGLQIAYTLVFPNDCRMFLHVPIYQDGYVYRIDRKNNNDFQVVLLEEHNMAVMPNSSKWSGYNFS